MTKTVEIYRLRVARGNHSAGGGNWTLYENRQDFEAAVFGALVEEATNVKEGTPERRRARLWLEKVLRGGKDVGLHEWTTQKVVAAEKLVNGQWVDLGARLVPPSVEFDAEKVPANA